MTVEDKWTAYKQKAAEIDNDPVILAEYQRWLDAAIISETGGGNSPLVVAKLKAYYDIFLDDSKIQEYKKRAFGI